MTASQTLDVVVADPTTATTTASANGYSAQVVSGSLDVQSTQNANGNVSANATLNVQTSSGDTNMTTAATGNSGINDSLGFADLTGALHQTTAPGVSIDAESQLNADQADATSINAGVQAIGNAQDIAVVGGSATMTSDQTNQAWVQAKGGAVLGYGGAQATFSAVATANNLNVTGTSGATTDVQLNQTNTGPLLQASQFVAAGNGQAIAGNASAVANNISVTNENNPLNVVTNQSNTSYVRGQAQVNAYEFGSGSAVANGVGNSVVAGNFGADLTLNNTQNNSGGGIEVLSSFGGTGGIGYDGYSSATAMGNAVTGYGCSTCHSKMTVTNRQTNSTDVSATSSVAMTSNNRAVNGVATAVGNTATFYVSQPDN